MGARETCEALIVAGSAVLSQVDGEIYVGLGCLEAVSKPIPFPEFSAKLSRKIRVQHLGEPLSQQRPLDRTQKYREARHFVDAPGVHRAQGAPLRPIEE